MILNSQLRKRHTDPPISKYLLMVENTFRESVWPTWNYLHHSILECEVDMNMELDDEMLEFSKIEMDTSKLGLIPKFSKDLVHAHNPTRNPLIYLPSPLLLAVVLGDLETVKLLVENGASLTEAIKGKEDKEVYVKGVFVQLYFYKWCPAWYVLDREEGLQALFPKEKMTPLILAEELKHSAIVDYLKSIQETSMDKK